MIYIHRKYHKIRDDSCFITRYLHFKNSDDSIKKSSFFFSFILESDFFKNNKMNKKEMITFVSFHFLQFILLAVSNVYRKELFKVFPYPFFVSFTESIFMLPLSFFISWSSHKFSRNFSFFKVPRPVMKWLIISSVIGVVSMTSMNIGFFVSSLDFVLLFRLTNIVWTGLFGILFLGEKLSLQGFAALAVVFLGIIITMKDFQWSTSKTPSTIQIFLQFITMLFHSINMLFLKKVLIILTEAETSFQLLEYLFWKSVIHIPVALFTSVFLEPYPWSHLDTFFNWRFFLWIFFGTIIHQAMHIVMTYTQKITTLITMGVISQLRVIGTLFISHIKYHETTWDLSKIFGTILLFIGGIIYSISRFNSNDSKENKTEDEEELIPEKNYKF